MILKILRFDILKIPSLKTIPIKLFLKLALKGISRLERHNRCSNSRHDFLFIGAAPVNSIVFFVPASTSSFGNRPRGDHREAAQRVTFVWVRLFPHFQDRNQISSRSRASRPLIRRRIRRRDATHTRLNRRRQANGEIKCYKNRLASDKGEILLVPLSARRYISDEGLREKSVFRL